jgi:uncharacterized protein (TIGR00251 family)
VEVIRAVDGAVRVRVRAQPGARRSELGGVVDGHVRIRLAAPSVDGKANVELIRLIAHLVGVRRGAVTIRRGIKSRIKEVQIVGVTVELCRQSLIS